MPMKPGTQVITFRITKELKDQIERVAAEHDRSVNNFLTHMVKSYLEAYEKENREDQP